MASSSSNQRRTAAGSLTTLSTPRLILYNRLPKTGSGTVEALLSSLVRRRSSVVSLRFGPDWPRDILTETDAAQYAHNLSVHRIRNTRVIYSRHMFYCDLPALLGFDLAQGVQYINVWRDPIARAVSALNWNHLNQH